MKRVVWIISEGSPGHVSQSVGLAEGLARLVPVEIRQFECRPRIHGFTRHLIRLFRMGKSGKPLSAAMVHGALGLEPIPSAEPAPDLIISSGGKSVFVARTLAARYGAPFVFLGERKPYPASWFHTVFTPSQEETSPVDVAIELIPTKITRDSVALAAREWDERPAGPVWAMLVGGASSSHRYTAGDWLALAEGINTWSRRDGIRWLITTSPRTGSETEALLREAIEPSAIAKAIWWAEKPEKNLAAILGTAEGICTTQDSVTMVSEAVATGKPVVSLRPSLTTFAGTSFLPGYFARLEKEGRTVRAELSRFAALNVAGHVFIPRVEPIQTELAKILIRRLGLF
ncbi:mitochondrial fission ELM1 family protein [Luteolibacter yonseiensis]|uniref:Mitochondrial fission ELM1 family protein n=1 Tax=Luteolibacter yonseiensis TaxID=1144680 RepID=A0A934VAI9_9BACT|nr:ELM1/GtrOC1 family putative glycosyltransferase [Luteolibacter yonseiensis]MBK1814911.1 mitochondrial fission ELM1 family protein [Luteolibacter yonseiensis]